MLVNNAGRASRYLFNIESADKLEVMLDDDYNINMKAPVIMVKEFSSLLSKSKGKVVNVTTELIYIPYHI